MPTLGQRMYVIRWYDGQPHIVGGKVIPVGRHRRPQRVKMPSGESVRASTASETMRGAVSVAVLDLARICLSQQKPFTMARLIVRLVRLLRKLERHGLA